jgi:hypothetical protein
MSYCRFDSCTRFTPLMTPISVLFITVYLICGAGAIQSDSSFRALLTDIESDEVRNGRSTLNTPSFYEERTRFRSLLDRSYVKSAAHESLPKCLTSRGDDAMFTRYDTRCSFTLTPSEYCCSVYAEQACMDPSLPLRTAVATVRDRVSGLDGTANSFLYDKCMLDNCSIACSASEGNDVHCKQCATVCQRSCLANLSLLCMRRVCGQNLISFAQGAVSMSERSSIQDPTHEWTENELKSKVHIPDDKVREIETHEVIEFVLDLLDPRVSVPMCRDSELVSADRSAGIFAQSGKTYSEALLRCTRNVLSPHKLFAIVSDPDILRNDEDCATISKCERDHESIAEDRANVQLRILKAQIASDNSSR